MGVRKIRNLLVSCLIALVLASCGSASPPISIPAPVEPLLLAFNSEVSGYVVVLGEPGAVEPEAVVTAINLGFLPETVQHQKNTSQLFWAVLKSLYMGSAQAQEIKYGEIGVPYETTAAPDGSFLIRLPGVPGESVEVFYTDPTTLLVSSSVIIEIIEIPMDPNADPDLQDPQTPAPLQAQSKTPVPNFVNPDFHLQLDMPTRSNSSPFNPSSDLQF